MLDICLIGCGGSMPIPNRYLTSMLMSFGGKMLLIDCGEGTQVSMKLLKWGFKDIDIICLTHFHADHVAGLPGLLLTIGNADRTSPLTIVGPPGLAEVVKGLLVIAPNVPFDLNIIELPMGEESELKIGEFIIKTLPVNHTIPCVAYSLIVNRSRKFSREKAEKENIPMKFWSRLQKGEEIIFENRELTPDMVLGEERKGLKVSYCTDSRPSEELKDFIKDSDVFICEGMYGDDEYLPKALENRHMLFSEAASLALKGGALELWLTHFSPSLTNPGDYLERTKEIFPNTYIGEDRLTKSLNFD